MKEQEQQYPSGVEGIDLSFLTLPGQEPSGTVTGRSGLPLSYSLDQDSDVYPGLATGEVYSAWLSLRDVRTDGMFVLIGWVARHEGTDIRTAGFSLRTVLYHDDGLSATLPTLTDETPYLPATDDHRRTDPLVRYVHPDMHAVQFVRAFLRFAAEEGERPDRVKSVWLAGSVNYREFDTYCRQADRAFIESFPDRQRWLRYAARQTKSARIHAEAGFGRIGRVELSVAPESVTVYYYPQ